MSLNKSTLTKTINELGFPNKEVVLTLALFFEGNEDYGSIGVNIYPDKLSPQTFYDAFKKLIRNQKADKIFVRVTILKYQNVGFIQILFMLLAIYHSKS